MNFKISILLQFLGVVIFFSSCTSYKNIPYLQDVPDTAKPQTANTVAFQNPVIKTDDILSITIQTLDQGITTFLNTPQLTTTAQAVPANMPNTPANAVNGYLVDKKGEIELPFAGKLKVEGLTTSEARDMIQGVVAKSFNNPIVNVRFANYRITVLGEVLRPGAYVVPNERVTVFDGLGLAGDLTIFGRRENILLMRDSVNAKQIIRLNLNSKDIIHSPYFYLKSNDIIYVEPSKYKIESVDAVRNKNITIAASVLSVLLVLFSRIVK